MHHPIPALTRLIVDVSSLVWTCLYAGTDKEFGREVEFEGRRVKINSAVHGFENAMNSLDAARVKLGIAPKDILLVPEGLNAKALRRAILPQYKDRDSRPPEAYDEFNKAKALLLDAWCSVGASACWQDGLEADDVMAYLATHLEGRRIIFTGDGDLTVLADPGRGIEVYRDGECNTNPYGPFPHAYITVYKALVGDPADKIPGAHGFGKKAFLDLYCVFGDESLPMMEKLILDNQLEQLAEDVPHLKVLQRVIDHREMVRLSYQCAKLYPELVNTLRMPLQWRAGMVRPKQATTHEYLAPYAGRQRLVHRDNYESAREWMRPLLENSPVVSLDIETSTSVESDEWLARVRNKSVEDDLGVDVFGSALTGMSLTFGDNGQYTLYFTVDHLEEEGVANITTWQALAIVKMIPASVPIQIQNCSFEFPILKKEWQDDEEWQANGWHGFIPNAHDTRIAARYVDENQSSGLKKCSKRYLDYDQTEYQTLMKVRCRPTEKPFAGGRQLSREEVYPVVYRPYKGKKPELLGTMVEVEDKSQPPEIYVTVEYRMNEVPASYVLAYGCDDTICTLALHNWYRIVMELEQTWQVYLAVEQLPQYLTSLSFLQGVPFSQQRMRAIEKEDRQAADAAETTLRQCLLDNAWEGSAAPVFTEITPAVIKEAFTILTGKQFSCMARIPDKIAAALEELGEDLLAQYVRHNNLAGFNKLVAKHFTVNPVLEADSTKQMRHFLYKVLGLPIRIVNKCTALEREEKPALYKAVRKHNDIWSGKLPESTVMTPEETELLYTKSSTDDSVIDFALAYDVENDPDTKRILEALRVMKKVATRQKLYYTPYPLLRHWADGRLHSAYNQCATTTLRYTSTGPNMQQLGKLGEGLKVRTTIVPHKRRAVVASIDFTGQELRLGAHLSRDRNMLACFIGERKKDMHSLTASGAMVDRWGKAEVARLAARYGEGLVQSSEDFLYDLFQRLRKADDEAVKHRAEDLRKDSKPVNFGAAYGITAPTLAIDMVIPVREAQDFLDAKEAMFPGYEDWKEAVSRRVRSTGFARTMLGARRHLRESILSSDKWLAERAMRQASNAEIQSSAGEMLKLAMGRMWERGLYHRYDAQFIAPVHDEVVSSISYERSDDDVVEFLREKHACMVAAYADMSVPILGSISIGASFGEQIECGDEFDEAAIRAALAKVKAMQEQPVLEAA